MERRNALLSLVTEVTLRAVWLAPVLLGLAWFIGETRLSLVPGIGWNELRFDVANPLLTPLILGMFGWDVLLWLGAWLGLRQTGGTIGSRRLEAFLALVLSIALWRVVLGRVWAVAVNEPGLSAGAGVLTWWVYAVLVALWKEPLAQTLLERDQRIHSPLLATFAWHHRKDGVFAILGALSLTLAWAGFPAALAETLLNLVKIGLLGTASIQIAGRCWEILVMTAKEPACS